MFKIIVKVARAIRNKFQTRLRNAEIDYSSNERIYSVPSLSPVAILALLK